MKYRIKQTDSGNYFVQKKYFLFWVAAEKVMAHPDLTLVVTHPTEKEAKKYIFKELEAYAKQKLSMKYNENMPVFDSRRLDSKLAKLVLECSLEKTDRNNYVLDNIEIK